MQRSKHITGLLAQYLRLRWQRAGTTGRVLAIAALVVGALAVGAFGRTLLSAACPASGSCPYSQASPCGGG